MSIKTPTVPRMARHCLPESVLKMLDGPGAHDTSYLTADRFTPRVSAVECEQALRQRALAVDSGSTAPVGLYIHIPFCESVCYFGACNKVVTRQLDQVVELAIDRLLHAGYAHIGTERGWTLSRDDRVRRSVINALMCQGRIDSESIELAHLIHFEADFEREFAAEFDRHLQAGAPSASRGHSRMA